MEKYICDLCQGVICTILRENKGDSFPVDCPYGSGEYSNWVLEDSTTTQQSNQKNAPDSESVVAKQGFRKKVFNAR